MTHRERRSYDHRIKARITAAGDPNLFPELEIPRSTAMSWIRRGVGEIVAIEHGPETETQLWEHIARLEHRVSVLTAVLRLVIALLRLSGFKLDHDRVPDAEGKRRLLGAIERAREIMPLTAALRVLGLSVARYHDWVGRQEGCLLDDHSSCPRSKPQCLTYQEIGAGVDECTRCTSQRRPTARAVARERRRRSEPSVTWFSRRNIGT